MAIYDPKKLVNIALAEVDYSEKKSNSQLDDKFANAGKNNWTKYARDLDKIPEIYNGNKNGYEWCDVFVDWCFVQAYGVDAMQVLLRQPDESLGAACKYSARYFRNKGQFFTSDPQVGDQIFFGKVGNESHTGIVVDVIGNTVYTVEGNTSDGVKVVPNGGEVCKKSYRIGSSDIAGYGRPAWNGKVYVDPTPTLKKGDRGAKVKEVQQRLLAHGYKLPRYGADSDFGDETVVAVKAFQKDKKLVANGIVDDKTWAELNKEPVKAEETKPATQPSSGDNGLKQFIREVQGAIGVKVDGIAGSETLNKTITVSAKTNQKHKVVRILQKRLAALGYNEVGTADGEAGPKFTAAVKHYQKEHNCEADGVITARNKTWKSLLGMI